MRRGIAAIAGCRVQGLRKPRSRLQAIAIIPPLAQFRRRVVGRTIVAVGRVGKRVVLELDSGDRIVLEPRMTGLILLGDPPDARRVRLVFELSGSSAGELLFWDQRGLGVVRLTTAAQFHQRYGPERLGPDALELSADTLRERLQASRRAIKTALMDQRALAGVGNLYASEILHRAGVHPALPCRSLRPGQWKQIHAAMRKILATAVEREGSTLRDGAYRVARDRPGGYQQFHAVYGRAGQPCLRCDKGEIVRIVQSGRSSFFCPVCQRMPRGVDVAAKMG